MDDARSRLLDAAGPIFADKGYRSATVREICLAARVNVAAVNYYFGDKQRLYIEAVKRASRVRAAEVPLPEWSTSTPAHTRLHDFVRTLLRRMLGGDQIPWQSQLMLREILRPTAACRELAEDHFRPQIETLLAILEGLVPADTPPHRKRQLAFSVVGQCLFYRVAGDVVAMITPEEEVEQNFRPDVLAEHITNFTLAALGQTELMTAKTSFPDSTGVP